MQQLRQYKKLLKVSCVSSPQANIFVFQIIFEQQNPHSLFKYQLTKCFEEIVELYNILDQQIFDFKSPFSGIMIMRMTKTQSELEQINQSLKDCLERIDVITHKNFLQFFCIQLHYQDFVNCLRHQQKPLKQKKQGREVKQEEKNFKEFKSMFSTEQPWKKKQNQKSQQKAYEVQQKMSDQQGESHLDKMTNLAVQLGSCSLQLMNQTQILDFTHINFQSTQLLYVLQQPRKTTKIKNFFKNVFSQNPKELGYLSIHRKEGGKYIKTSSLQLMAEPLSMQYISRTNMIMITTSVGVYLYLSKMQAKLQELTIFSYVELMGCVDCAHNPIRAQLYLLTTGSTRGQLHVYSINDQKLMKTQYKYEKPSCICFEQHHHRLYVSDSQGIHIYLVVEFLQIKKLHLVKVDTLFKSLIINHGYLLALSGKGLITVVELKPPQKEQLTSVTTTISLPQQALSIVGSSKNKRLIVTYYKRNIVLIDTMQGPISSLNLYQNTDIQSIFSNKDKGTIISLSTDGHLIEVKLSELII